MEATEPQPLELMLELPALMAPPGVKYNFVNPPDMQTDFYIDLVLCLAISSLAVSMRVWTKARLIKKFGREDCKEFSILPLSKFTSLTADEVLRGLPLSMGMNLPHYRWP